MDQPSTATGAPVPQPMQRSRWQLAAGLGSSLLVASVSALLLVRAGNWKITVIYPGLVLVLGLLWALLLRAFVKSHRQQARLLLDLQAQASLLNETRRIAEIGDWIWDVDTGRIRWSQELYRIHGRERPPQGLSLELVGSWVHPDDRTRLEAYFAAACAGADGGETEYRVVRPDGQVRHIYARAEWADRTPGQRVLRGIQQDVTERTAIREQLRAKEEGYAFLFEHNPLPMWVFDRTDLRFLAVNAAMLEQYGYALAELLAGTMLDIRPPEDAAALRQAAALDSVQRPQGEIWTHLRKDGTRLQAAIHTRDIVFDGKPARLVLAVDVSERERMEQRFQLIARATSDAVWDWDIATGHLWWSDSFFALFGHSRDAVPSRIDAWDALVHPDDRERVHRSLRQAIEGAAQEWSSEYRFRRGDGSYAEVTDRGFLLRDGDGQAIRAAGGMLDVTQKKRDENNLRLLQQAIEATDDGIALCDARQPDLPIVYVNPAFEKITGYAQAEVLGRNCRFLQGDDADQAALEAVRLAVRETTETKVLLRNYRKDGTLFWNEFHVAPMRDGDGVLTHYLGVLADVSERQRYEEQLAYRATHDELTGLPNRQLLHDRLQQAIRNAERHGREVAVVFVDLDDFKLINDSLGHGAGDAALKVIAERLQGIVRGTDTVGRFGGDEFVIVLTEQADDEGMRQVVQRVSDTLSQPIELAGVRHVLTPSLGHCRYPQAGRDAETLLKRADLAMYQAKRQGRNRAIAYREEFDAAVSQRLQLVSRLREALRDSEFTLAFQPLFDPAGRLLALEALARWQHPQRGLLMPSEFITVCEESGLIVDLGRFVLREAARHHALLAATGLGQVRLAVNVSAAQFGHDLFADVAAVVAEFDLPADVLDLEITESVIMDNPERAIDTMQRIAALGVGLSVDDFGTGYSSLAYLKRLPIDRLKIDRSFVQDLGHDADDAVICTSIIGLGHLLGLRIVAEGVETQQQLDWLRERGCDELQGYLLGRPQSFESLLTQLLAQRSPAHIG